MMTWLAQLQPWHWLLAAIVLMLAELAAPGIYLFWLGMAAGGVALLLWALPSLSWQAQFLAFAVGSLVSVQIVRRLLQRSTPAGEPALNRRGEQYRGRVVTLDEPIVDGAGRIRLDDTRWRVEGPDLPAGRKVRITGVDGSVLKVAPVEEPPHT